MRIKLWGENCKKLFKEGEERRIVEGLLVGFVGVLFFEREGVCNCKLVFMNFEICVVVGWY